MKKVWFKKRSQNLFFHKLQPTKKVEFYVKKHRLVGKMLSKLDSLESLIMVWIKNTFFFSVI